MPQQRKIKRRGGGIEPDPIWTTDPALDGADVARDLGTLREALELLAALPHPSAGRELVLEAARRLEATAADGAADAVG